MTKLSASDLSSIRDDYEALFDDSATLNHRTRSSGTYSDAEHDVYTSETVSCNVFFPGGIFNAEFDRGTIKVIEYDILMMLPYDTSVDHDDFFSDIEKAGVTISGSFQVVSQQVLHSGFMHLKLKQKGL